MTVQKSFFTYEPSPYERLILELVKNYGGWINAHTHIDRADTLDPKYWTHAGIDPLEAATLPLSVKQKLVGELHKGLAYQSQNLRQRMTSVIEAMIANGTKEVTTLIDATTDIGMIAIDLALALKKKYDDQIKIKVGPQPIFGFKDHNSDRWKLFAAAAKKCDVLGGLPEKDDSPNRIGFDQHIKLVLNLGIELGKEVHIHVDQANDPSEIGTERLIEAVRWLGSPKTNNLGTPSVWAVHAISPACYGEKRFKRLLDNLKAYNIGIICCPRAAITMRQLRPIMAPTHNCITRLLEMVAWEIPIRIGTDNIADIFIPSGSTNMVNEVTYLSDNMRYFITKLWAKIACGIEPNDMDRNSVVQALLKDYAVFKNIDPVFQTLF